MAKAKLFPRGKAPAARVGRANSAAGNSTGNMQASRDDDSGGYDGMLGDASTDQGGGVNQSAKTRLPRRVMGGTVAQPMMTNGATDGLGAGVGGLAIHPSASRHFKG